jgi:hypothetical protein
MSSAAKLKPSMRSIYSTSVVSPTNRLDTNCHDEKSSNYPEQKSKKLGLDGAECSIVDLSVSFNPLAP